MRGTRVAAAVYKRAALPSILIMTPTDRKEHKIRVAQRAICKQGYPDYLARC